MRTPVLFYLTIFVFSGAAALTLPAYGSQPETNIENQPASTVSVSALESTTLNKQGRPLAIVRRFNPLVIVRHIADDDWIDAVRTHPLHDADTLRTGEDGFAVVQFMDNSIARVRPNSLLIVNGEVRAPNNTSSRISIEVGDMFLNIRSTNSAYEVATPSAVAAVRGTQFSTHVDDTGQSFFTGFSGEVEITALTSGQAAILSRGQRASVDADGEEIDITDVSDDDLNSQYAAYDDMDSELDIRIMRLRFVNEEGEVETIEFEYYEEEPDDE